MSLYNNNNGADKTNSASLNDRARAYLDKPVTELELSVRSRATVEMAGIRTIRELVAHTELDMLRYRNFGRKSLNELKQILADIGLQFGMKLDE